MTYIIIPLIGAFIGYVTNYIAVKMLFHPRFEKRFLFITFHGIFPKRQAAFAKKLGEVVSNELISVDEITARIADKASSERVVAAVSDHLEKVIREKLPKALPMLAMFMTPELTATIKNTFAGEMKEILIDVVKIINDDISQELDVHQIVHEKVLNFSPEKLEEILFAIMKREFAFIEIIGGVLGFLIGIIQVLLMDLIS
jgi:uncharacterized membrane protein YheB (UPF0754 family)